MSPQQYSSLTLLDGSADARVDQTVTDINAATSMPNVKPPLAVDDTRVEQLKDYGVKHDSYPAHGSIVPPANEISGPRRGEPRIETEPRRNTKPETENHQVPFNILLEARFGAPQNLPGEDIDSHSSETELDSPVEEPESFAGEGSTRARKRSSSIISAPGRLEPNTFSLKRQRSMQAKSVQGFRKDRKSEGGWSEEGRSDKSKRTKIHKERDEGAGGIFLNRHSHYLSKGCLSCRCSKVRCGGSHLKRATNIFGCCLLYLFTGNAGARNVCIKRGNLMFILRAILENVRLDVCHMLELR
ncbi:hypothetical protein BDV93DRAFT_130940 [Ceratobasidium sp. AG-I]|nr:hypothetical protein BDV93DRAFT_130940 [Ceratobasidium sp. AG-I]